MLSVSMDVPLLDISYKGDPTIHGLFQLASFAQDRVVEVDPCRNVGQYLVPFHGRNICLCVTLPCFIGVFIGGCWSFSHFGNDE